MSLANPLDDAATPGAGVPSPCRSLCRLDEADLCTGCGRSRDDIRRWTSMPPGERLACVARAARQRQAWESRAAHPPASHRG